MMVMNVRPVRTEEDYQAALARIETLMCEELDVDETDELEVLVTLVDIYEAEHFPIDLPHPVAAIRFRMEQQNLSQSDLVPYFGSRAKVSEVLAGKRPLTLRMIRALHDHLHIPAEVLIAEEGATLPSSMANVEWEKFPVREMAKWNWIEDTGDVKDRSEEIIRDLIAKAVGDGEMPIALYRKNDGGRRNVKADSYALRAWCLYVLSEARRKPPKGTYMEGMITTDFLRDVAKLSQFDDGPKKAKEHLDMHGIALIYAKHLSKTYLDGAAMRTIEGIPVVGVTLRYDRVDNFWFCLLHELSHIGWHMSDDGEEFFIDDLSLRSADANNTDVKEAEADKKAEEALIPSELWSSSSIEDEPTPLNVFQLARAAEVHPAVIAGRVRYLRNNYRLLSQFVGSGKVRKHFCDEGCQ